MKEVSHILDIFKESRKALDEENAFRLKDLSNQTIHTVSITQDSDNILVAVIIYSLSKIIQRDYHKDPKGRRFFKTLVKAMDDAIKALEKGDKKKFEKNLELMRISIDNVSGKLKDFIKDVFNKASINKASKIYEHGISLGKTARLLGITQWELADYSGQKNSFTDFPENRTIGVKDRVKLIMEMFE